MLLYTIKMDPTGCEAVASLDNHSNLPFAEANGRSLMYHNFQGRQSDQSCKVATLSPPSTLAVTRLYYTDRLFSQIVRHFLSLFAAKHLGKPHIHWPYPDRYTNECFAKLFDLPQILDREDSYDAVLEMMRARKVAYWCDQTIGHRFAITTLFSPENIQRMRSAYRYSTHTPTFDPNERLNVAVHIRRGDIALHPYESRYTHLDFFVRYINVLQRLYPFAHFHVYSDSSMKLGEVAKEARVTYHILEDLLQSMHDMIHAHVLLMSVGSNMSFFAGLLSRGVVFFDRRKLHEEVNTETNRWWAKHPQFIQDDATFLRRVWNVVNPLESESKPQELIPTPTPPTECT